MTSLNERLLRRFRARERTACGSLAALLVGLAACGSSGGGAGPGADASASDDGARGDGEPVSDSTAPRDDASTSRDGGTGAADSGSRGDSGSDAGLAACDSGALSADEQTLVNLPADSWYTAQGTSFLGSGACIPVPGGSEGCGAVINDWSGGVYDPVHDKMLIWGGGHNGYWGNEVYSFDPASFTWKRETTPSAVTAASLDQDPLPDGNPDARHTYDQIAYITHANRLWSRGGSRANDGSSTGLTWTLDLGTQQWTNRIPTGAPWVTTYGTFNGASAYDPTTRKVFLQTVEGLQTYDYDTNTWAQVIGFGSAPLWPRYMTYGCKRGAIDTKRSLFFTFGGGDYFVFDITASDIVTDSWITTGGGAFDNSSYAGIGQSYPNEVIHTGGGDVITACPGVDYDPRADALVAWKGGAPYVLDLASKVWTAMSATGALPTPSMNGVYGRFRYIAKYNVFILVNGPNDDVTFYKHTAGCGP